MLDRYRCGINILGQHRDAEENVFFQKIEWTQPGDLADLHKAAEAFSAMARETLEMSCRVAVSSDQPAGKPGQPAMVLFIGRF